MKRFSTYKDAEVYMVNEITHFPTFINSDNNEVVGLGFVLENPLENRNDHSNYDYAEKFFRFVLSGEKTLSQEVINANPWTTRFMDPKGLPDNFSTSYGWKIKDQLPKIIEELQEGSRRAYLNILLEEDHIILGKTTTHEYPCTVGIHFMVRENQLNCLVQMRSNNIVKVMPYDVFNFTSLQAIVAKQIGLELGSYFHQVSSAHIFFNDLNK
jgi:thymidylate synthase